MEKPITMRIDELKNTLIGVINSSELPPFLLEPIIKNLYEEVRVVALQQKQAEKEEYEKSLNKTETVK